MYQSLSIERNNRFPFTVDGRNTVTGEHAVERAASASQRVSVSALIHGNCNV